MSYDIYLLRCENNSIYTGIAKNYKERFEKHKKGEGAKYTRMYKPLRVEAVFSCKNRSEASKIEKFIKSKTKKEKELYIREEELLKDFVLKSMEIEITKKIF